MSKIYDYQMQMDELANEAGYQEHLMELEMTAQEEEYGQDEEVKAKKFAKMLLEVS